jgi:hypothetical protein
MIDEMVLDPKDLRILGSVYEESWRAFAAGRPASAIKPEMRLRLASTLLHLARDRQLGPHQMKATAVRLLEQEYPRLAPAG